MRIGGIDIEFSAPSSTRLRIANPLYRPFLNLSAGAARSPRMSVRVLCDAWPLMQDLEKVFDTRDSWSLCRDEKSYWLNLAPLGCESPLWIARLDRGARRVDLYCQAGPEEKNGKRVISLPLVYPLDQLLLMYFLARRRGILAHAAGMVRGGKVFIFPGASGAGKSTFSQLLAAAKTGKMLSDERMIVREIEGKMIAFGTPWAGTAGIARNGSAPLAGIFFLKHGKSNRIEKLDAIAAADRLLPMISVPWYDPDTAAPIIAFAKRLVVQVPAYEMSFTPDPSAIDFFWKFIKKSS
ncbi:MAG: hypothetical protein MUP71_11675 [Candidatus Aminicenantes bacterium]|nr:hypothetical protein [Candidatus Aminicenantes bacterium]